MKFMIAYSPVRKTKNPNPNRSPRVTSQYLIRKVDGTMVDVCAVAFSGLTGFSRCCCRCTFSKFCYLSYFMFTFLFITAWRRLNLLSKHFYDTGEAKPERRGGSRQTPQQREITKSVIAFIKRQKVVKSHYGAAKSYRQYLSHDLNISKLYRMWIAERRAQNQPISKKTKFDNVFYEYFNLSFGQPKIDVCSTCKLLTAQTTQGTPDEREEAEVSLKRHNLKWKKFYKLLEESRKDRSTLAIVLDLQQTMPLPRTNVSEAFYKRQLWLYNLGIVVHDRSKEQKPKNVYLYLWLESEAGRGSNEITSCLRNFLHSIRNRARKYGYRHLHIFSDSCGGQNKNQAMIACL